MKGVRMLEYKEGDHKIGRINIHYYRTGGSKPPFVLLHGATDNGLCWSPVAELLAREYDVIMVDAPGHGLSSRIDPGSPSPSRETHVIELIEHLELGHPVIMGHSMGAGTTVNIAVNQPLLPKAIILEDPGWRAPETIDAQNREESNQQRDSFVKTLVGYANRTLEELITECRKTNPLWSEDEILLWAQAKLQFDPSQFSNMRIDRSSYTELVPRIQCPTLLITSDGGIVSSEIARHASQLWKSKNPFRLVQINGAGHNIRREQFRAFMDTITQFLQGL
jgi:N-formylmaleamate deformylase